MSEASKPTVRIPWIHLLPLFYGIMLLVGTLIGKALA